MQARMVVLSGVLSVCGATAALAQAGASACPAAPAPPPPELTGWSRPTALAAAADGAGAALAPGRAAQVRLIPTRDVAFAAPPEKPSAPDARGGLLSLPIDRAATYRVALGAPAWIDLLRDGKPLASVGHGHGPACTGVAKMVDFRLQPGRYTLQLSGASQAEVTVMVARLP